MTSTPYYLFLLYGTKVVFHVNPTCFKIMWLFPQTVKNFINCKRNVYCSFCMELDLLMQFIALHFTWDTPWIPTWMKYRVSRVSEYIYICIIYDLKLFQLNVTFGWWCLLYTANLNQPLNQLKFINASYDTYCEKYLLKLKFMKLSNFAWFIDLFVTSFNQRYSLRYHIFYIWWVLLDNSDYQSNTIHILYRLLISTFDGYCLIIQIINQILFIYFVVLC